MFFYDAATVMVKLLSLECCSVGAYDVMGIVVVTVHVAALHLSSKLTTSFPCDVRTVTVTPCLQCLNKSVQASLTSNKCA